MINGLRYPKQKQKIKNKKQKKKYKKQKTKKKKHKIISSASLPQYKIEFLNSIPKTMEEVSTYFLSK
jgi:hypothetical protein